MKTKIINHPTKTKDVKMEELYGNFNNDWHERASRLQARRWHAIRAHMTIDGMAKNKHTLHRVG